MNKNHFLSARVTETFLLPYPEKETNMMRIFSRKLKHVTISAKAQRKPEEPQHAKHVKSSPVGERDKHPLHLFIFLIVTDRQTEHLNSISLITCKERT